MSRGKELSIIVPHYSEPEREIFPLLTSINNQLGVDFGGIEVVICDDGGAAPLSADLFNLFDFETRRFSLRENLGPGMARQLGIDNARGKYLVFCDADDRLQNTGAVGALLYEARNTDADMVASAWLEEVIMDGVPRYLTHGYDCTWMHGKIIKKDFLAEKGIRHHPALRVHEDSYLLAIASACAAKIGYLDATTYVWKHTEGSITRRDGAAYTWESMPAFIHAITEAYGEIGRRGLLTAGTVLQFVLYIYFTAHLPQWLEAGHKNHLDEMEKALAEHVRPYWHLCAGMRREDLAAAYTSERERTFKGWYESETFGAWLERLGLHDIMEEA